MTTEDQIDKMTKAMGMCEARLQKEYDEDTIALAKAAIAAMVQTIGINAMESEPRIDMGKTLNVVLTILRTLDTASDHAAGVIHEKN